MFAAARISSSEMVARADGAKRPPYHSSYRHTETWRNEITSSNCESRSADRVARGGEKKKERKKKKAEGAPGT